MKAVAILSESEIQLIDICVRIAKFLGFPKSMGELYGLIFVSDQPLCLDMLAERLEMSKGSASQGLKMLRDIGAVSVVYVPGDRRDYYAAEANLDKLLGGFLRERIEPGIADLGERLRRIEETISGLPASQQKRVGEKLARLKRWQRQFDGVRPWMGRLFGSDVKKK